MKNFSSYLRSKTNRTAITPWVRPSPQNALSRFVFTLMNDLPLPEQPALIPAQWAINHMTQIFQLLYHFLGDSLLQRHRPKCASVPCADTESRHVKCHLRVHSKVNHIAKDLQL